MALAVVSLTCAFLANAAGMKNLEEHGIIEIFALAAILINNSSPKKSYD